MARAKKFGDPLIEKIAAADLIIARHQFVLGMLKVALPKDAIFDDVLHVYSDHPAVAPRDRQRHPSRQQSQQSQRVVKPRVGKRPAAYPCRRRV